MTAGNVAAAISTLTLVVVLLVAGAMTWAGGQVATAERGPARARGAFLLVVGAAVTAVLVLVLVDRW